MANEKAMRIEDMREEFEKTNDRENSEIIRFEGVGDYTVYNCSLPVEFNGETYMFGRVEKKEFWANSYSALFKKDVDGVYRRVKDNLTWNLEDPFWAYVNGEYVLGGNIVYRDKKFNYFRTMFFRSKDIFDWYHFACGPEMMKDIRLVQLPENKIGVFSRPRGQEMMEKYGCESMVGFTVINDLNELTIETIESAPYIPNLFEANEWGGVNQAIYLGNNKIGLIGHQCYNHKPVEKEIPCYLCTAYVYDMEKNWILEKKIIATRDSFPKSEPKIPQHFDCAFTTGIEFREDGKVNLYSGLSDFCQGVKVIENPFAEYMKK